MSSGTSVVDLPEDIQGWHWGHDLHCLVYLVQHCVVAVLFLIINAQVPSWGNWDYPFQAVFFPVHILVLMSDYVKYKQWHHKQNKLIMTSQQMWNDQVLCFVTLFVDITLLVNQAVAIKNNHSNPGVIQVALVAFVVLVSCIRAPIAWCRERIYARKKLLLSRSSRS